MSAVSHVGVGGFGNARNVHHLLAMRHDALDNQVLVAHNWDVEVLDLGHEPVTRVMIEEQRQQRT